MASDTGTPRCAAARLATPVVALLTWRRTVDLGRLASCLCRPY